MDLRQHLRVWWRWRIVLAVGLLAAAVLGTLATFAPSFSGLKWRSTPEYTSTSRLFVTQPGFPWGRATLPGADPNGTGNAGTTGGETFAAPDRFSNLALVYSYIGQSDVIRSLISPRPVTSQIQVAAPVIPGSSDPLPLLEITTKASSSADAQKLNAASIRALGGYLKDQLDANKVAEKDRVQLQVLNPPTVGFLTGGRSLTLSIVTYILVMVGTFVLLYVLENLYPTVTPKGEPEPAVELLDDPPLMRPEPDLEAWPAAPASSRRSSAA
jgi:hypothetical protein